MKNLIKPKPSINIMKRLTMMIFMVICMLTFVNASSFLVEQTDTSDDYYNAEVTQANTYALFEDCDTCDYSVNNQQCDLFIRLDNVDEDTYFVQNLANASEFNITYRYTSSTDQTTANPQQETFSFQALDTGDYIFKLDVTDNLADVFVCYTLTNTSITNTLGVTEVYVVSKQPTQMFELIEIMINAVVELISYNLLIWEICLWVFSFGFVLFIIFSALNLLIGFAKKIRETREAMVNKRRRGD